MKHKNYDILNLIGYGLAKFDRDFLSQFEVRNNAEFYRYIVSLGIAETEGVVKNRRDLFDNFFDNGRKGWWQKGDVYIHRKQYIDSLFGLEDVKGFADVVKMIIKEHYAPERYASLQVSPLLDTRFRSMQETGLEAELFFVENYKCISSLSEATLEDARVYGDGYDFLLTLPSLRYLLVEVKGIRENRGLFRLTEKEYHKAKEYKDDYYLGVVFNLAEKPRISLIQNPLEQLEFRERNVIGRSFKEYHLVNEIC